MNSEIFTKHLQLVLHEDNEPDKYIGTAHLYLYGDICFVDSVIGPGAMRAIAARLPELEAAYGITRIEGFVLPEVFRAAILLSSKLDVRVIRGREIDWYGRRLVWMTVKEY